MAHLVFVVALLASDPITEGKAAAAHAATLGPDAKYARYLSTYNLEDSKDTVKALRFWCNSLSSKKRFAYPREVNESLYWIDLRDYGWTAPVWDVLAKGDPYFSPFYDRELYALTASYYAVVRADYFLATSSLEPHYSSFLYLPDTLGQLKKDIFLQEDGIKKLSLAEGGAVLQSVVALHNRRLTRVPKIGGGGYFWGSEDVLNNQGKKNVLESGNLFAIDFDGGEFIWSLSNTLQGYYVTNAKGKQLAVVPADVAQDSVSPFRDKQVRNARSCVSCHAKGINTFEDVIARMLKDPNVGLLTYEKKVSEALEDFYLSDLGKQITRDQQSYVDAVKTVNGLESEANAKQFAGLISEYIDELVTKETATRELGASLETSLVGTQSGTLVTLLSGGSVPRDAWEEAYKEAITRKYQRGKP